MSGGVSNSSDLHRKVAFIVLISVVLSIGTTMALMHLFGQPLNASALAVAVVCPVLVATPVSHIFLRQSFRLEEINSQLNDAHAKLARAHEILADRVRYDHMTGLLNRETFMDVIEPDRRKSNTGFVFIVDVDHFKQINDTHGHQSGDRALVGVAEAIKSSIRIGDAVGRIGGEEFAVFLPRSSLAEAISVSERICKTVEDLDLHSDSGVPFQLTVSVGGAEFVGDRPVDQLLGKADRMLYEAKNSGRNRAFVVPEIVRAA